MTLYDLYRSPLWITICLITSVDLYKLGYCDPLLVLILGNQATMLAINSSEVHKFVQDTNLAALVVARKDNEPLLLLTILDLSQWTQIFECVNVDLAIVLVCLKKLHIVLHDILLYDEYDLEIAKKNHYNGEFH